MVLLVEEFVLCRLEILLCAIGFSMRVSELSVGYGKFEYKTGEG